MFLAFNKDALEGKSFEDFGKSMEDKYGHAKEVYRDEKIKGGIKHTLDHFEWSAGGDRLKLVDRSEFYGVYCLVLFDQSTPRARRRAAQGREPRHRETATRSSRPSPTRKDGNDENDNIIDRLTGHEVKKPGDERSTPTSSCRRPPARRSAPPR